MFLALAADEQGLSCWRLDIMQRTMPAFHFHQFRDARDALMRKRLLAFKPWNPNDPDGVYQLLPVPSSMKSEADNNLQTFLAGLRKGVRFPKGRFGDFEMLPASDGRRHFISTVTA